MIQSLKQCHQGFLTLYFSSLLLVYVAWFSSKNAGASFIQRWEKGTTSQAVQAFHHSSSANPSKEQASFSKCSLLNFGKYSVWPLVEIWWVSYPSLGLISTVGRALETDSAIKTTLWSDTELSMFTVRVNGRWGTVPSTTLTLFPITLPAKGTGTYQTSVNIWGRCWVVSITTMQTT